MGVKQLNHFLIENCSSQSIYKASLKQFSGKVLVIDTSIYLYKFAEKNAVAENIYLLISVLLQYDIIPVFIFDGKPPPEKKALLLKRKQEKDAAEEKYNELKTAIQEGNIALSESAYELEALKRQFIRVTDSDILKSKQVMRAYGVSYIESRGESDILCAFLVKHQFAWACVSDDMDMFLYGCPRVIRHLSLLNHEAMFYDTESILRDLDMTQDTFNDIAILSGTDYNINDQKTLSSTVKLYTDYRKWLYDMSISTGKKSGKPVAYQSFYSWLINHTNYVQNGEQLEKIRNMFALDEYLVNNREEFKDVIDVLPFRSKNYLKSDLIEVLKEDGFIFL